MALTPCWTECQSADVARLECLVCIFESLLNIAIRIGGILVLVMFLIGGFKYLTAGGDPKKASQAWNTLSFAVLGLVLMILAWFIMLFLAKFTGLTGPGAPLGIDILDFKIGN